VFSFRNESGRRIYRRSATNKKQSGAPKSTTERLQRAEDNAGMTRPATISNSATECTCARHVSRNHHSFGYLGTTASCRLWSLVAGSAAPRRIPVGSPAARQLPLVYRPTRLPRGGRAGCRNCVGSSHSPYRAADLIPARIFQPIHINVNVFFSLQVLQRITPRMSARLR
jgi:hypothetical protein